MMGKEVKTIKDDLLHEVQEIRRSDKKINEEAKKYWIADGRPAISEQFLVDVREHLQKYREMLKNETI